MLKRQFGLNKFPPENYFGINVNIFVIIILLSNFRECTCCMILHHTMNTQGHSQDFFVWGGLISAKD